MERYDWTFSSADDNGKAYADGKNRYHVIEGTDDPEHAIRVISTHTSKRAAMREVKHLNMICATCDYQTCNVNGRCCLD